MVSALFRFRSLALCCFACLSWLFAETTLASGEAPVASDVYAAVLATDGEPAEPHTTTVILNASDIEGDNLAFDILTLPSTGVLSEETGGTSSIITSVPHRNSSAIVQYTPPTGFSGEASFQFTASDGAQNSAAATATINVFDRYRQVARQISDFNSPLIGGAQRTVTSFTSQFAGPDIAMAMSVDGKTFAFGEHNFDGGKGRVRVFRLVENNWEQLGPVISTSEECLIETKKFGYSLALSADGNVLVVGAPGRDTSPCNTRETTGEAALYRFGELVIGEQSFPTWERLTKVMDSFGSAAGYAVDLSANGEIFVVGSRFGATRVFNKNGQQIGGDITQSGAVAAVSLSGDGQVVAVSTEGAQREGAVGVYRLDDGRWIRFGQLLVGQNSTDQFGAAIDLADTGTSIAIGAPGYDIGGLPNAGQVNIYDFVDVNWSARGEPINGDEFRDSACCVSVSLSADGQTVAVGWNWIGQVNNNNAGFGVARIYTWSGSVWSKRGVDIDAGAGYQRGVQNETLLSLSADGQALQLGSVVSSGSSAPGVQLYDLTDNAPSISGESYHLVEAGALFQFSPELTDADPDDSVTLSLAASTGQVPDWLHVTADGAGLAGTPNSTDASVPYTFNLVAIDKSLLQASLPLTIEVVTDSDFDGLFDVCSASCRALGFSVDDDDDNDGVLDVRDVFPLDPLESADADADGTGDNADTDDDNDGLNDDRELLLGTDPFNSDSDGDGWSDGEEVAAGTDPLSSSSEPDFPTGLPVWLLYQSAVSNNVTATISISGDDSYVAYLDGAVIVDITIGSMSVVSDATWQYSLQASPGWNEIGGPLLYALAAVEYGDVYSERWWNRGPTDTSGASLEGANFPLTSSAHWIWSMGLTTDSDVYLRKEFIVPE